ncbi:MAG: GNAT family N-acetyltransferase [Halobacteriovoraceae bacterium]|nr:GNAT family N-acetyltransferase [Halobacteriovoraceae bacterium]|tara:strand:- start:262421 stop:262981 length:561 start_codon:yes stop_codon:yes gene_type:complete
MCNYLKTDRVRLRQFNLEDEALIQDLDSDPEVMRFLTDGVPSDDALVKKTIKTFLELKEKTNGRLGYWAAVDCESGEFIGWFQLRPLKEDPENNEVLELGYRLKRKFWGKGIGTEVSKALVKKAFEVLAAKEVWAIAHKSNLGSTNIMKKCGLTYQYEKEYPPYPGRDKKCVYYRITHGEFKGLYE